MSDETWIEWGVRRTWGDVGSVAPMWRIEAERAAREWPGELVRRTVVAEPWGPPEAIRTASLADSGDLNDQLGTTDSGEAARGAE